jgi:hypothetical protein
MLLLLLVCVLQTQTGRLGRLKKVMKYVFSGQPELRASCSSLLRVQPGQVTPEQLLDDICEQVGRPEGGGERGEGERNHWEREWGESERDQGRGARGVG